MNMNNTITITSKGQTTLPIAIRRKLGLGTSGGVLHMTFNERTGELTISKPISISELSQRVSRHIQPGTPPVENVNHYYQTTRKTDV